MTDLRIAVIAHALRAGGGISVGRNLIASMLRVGNRNTYLCVVPTGLDYEVVCERQAHCEPVYYRRLGGHTGRWHFDEFVLPRRIDRFAPDVVLALGGRGLSGGRYPQAIFCQDSHYFYPSKHFGEEVPLARLLIAYKNWRLRHDLEQTQLVFCQTPVAARRLRETYGYVGEVAVASNAVSMCTMAGTDGVTMPTALARITASTKLFCLTRYYAHKNLEAIVRMFDRYRDELRDVAVVLTISANDHPNAGKLLRSIQRLGLERNIVNVGPLRQVELAAYYRHCQSLFLPTLLESFSGTYLEAMHFGCPILTSDLDFARYVCEGAALYFDPWSIEDMKDAILKIKNDSGLARRLAKEGSMRIKADLPSWDDVAITVLEKLGAIHDRRLDKGE